MDKPLQLIDFKSPEDDKAKSEIKMDFAVLEKVIESCGDHKISVVCVCGPSRKGKSFLLGYMIRYFEALEQGHSDWIGRSNEDKPLTGFRFENRVDPITQGIWIWSRPFIIGTGDSSVAVLLVDTQGTGDEYTTERDMISIVSLSLLFSSMMIFNFFTMLDENALGAFDTYIQYGLLAMTKNNRGGKPFQKVTFLIRDWNCPGDYPYGECGGKDFLKEKLKLKPGQSKESQRVRESIKDCFENTECFLMPFIGQKGIEKSFAGSISELDPSFAKHLEEFISQSFDVKNLVKKQILGNLLTGQELKTYLLGYVEIFNSDEIPSPVSVWRATVEATNGNLVAKALKSYTLDMEAKMTNIENNEYIPESIFKKYHDQAQSKAIKLLHKCSKFGTDEDYEEIEERLVQNISKEAARLTAINSLKRQQFISATIAKVKTDFQMKLKEAFPLGELDRDLVLFFEATKINKYSQETKAELLQSFKKAITLEAEPDKAILVEQMETALEEVLETTLLQNEACKAKAIEQLASIRQQLIQQYKSIMNEFREENEFADEETLRAEHEKCKTLQIQRFLKKVNTDEGHKKYKELWEKQLVTGLNDELKNQETAHRLHLKELFAKTEEIISEWAATYKEDIDGYVEATCECQHELKSFHNDRIISYKAEFDNEQNPYPDASAERKLFTDKLEQALNDAFKSAEIKMDKALREMDDLYRNACEQCITRYTRNMEDVLKDATTREEISEKHISCVDEEKNYLRHLKFPPKSITIRTKYLSQYIDKLEQAVDKVFERISQDFSQQQILSKSSASNWKFECKTYYETSMKESMLKTRNLEDLKQFHEDAILAAVELLMSKCTENDNVLNSFDELAAELENELNIKCLELTKAFETNLKATNSDFSEVVQKVRENYKKEMETHFANHRFIRPDFLEQLHAKASSIAFSKACNAGESLEENIQNGAKGELNKLFADFCTRNDMNLNLKFIPAIGIDLGTTNCCVGVFKNGDVTIIPAKGKDNSSTTPSYVAFNENGTKCEAFGHAAKDQAYINPENTIFDVKRIIGKPMSDKYLKNDMKSWPFTVTAGDKGQPMIEVGRKRHQKGNLLNPSSISAMLLSRLRESAEEQLMLEKNSIKKAVITIPAYFNSDQRQATLDAGAIAGFKKVDLLTEPVAAAFAYKVDMNDNPAKKILIYDLGGGTFDVAIIDVESGIDVLAIGGDDHLGGEDFDRRLVEQCANQFTAETGIDVLGGDKLTINRARRRLQTQCENAKRNLSSAKSKKDSTTVAVDAIYEDRDLKVRITRWDFERLNEVDFQKTIQIVDDTIKSVKIAGFRKEDIDDVILVGGSSKIPRVRELLQEYFGGKALNISINPDEAVAYGAARQAAILNGADSKGKIDFFAIQDVTPMDLGTEVVSKRMSVIVPRNTKIPCKCSEVYTTVNDNQTGIDFKIFQGDKPIAKQNRLIGEFSINGLPKGPAGHEETEASMEIDSMGILHVSVVSKSLSHVKSELTISEESQRITKSGLITLEKRAAQMLAPEP